LVNQQDQLVGQPTGSTVWSTSMIDQFVNQKDQPVCQPTGSTSWSTNKINWLANQQDQPADSTGLGNEVVKRTGMEGESVQCSSF
jgi:hypothetical protein